MVGKLARIFGITGGALTLLPCLLFIADCIYSLALPSSVKNFESDGYAFGFLILLGIPFTILATVGFAGGFLVRKRHILAGVMMIASGLLMLVFGGIIEYNFVFRELLNMASPPTIWLSRIPQLLLIAAGILSLIYHPGIALPKPQEDTPSENAE